MDRRSLLDGAAGLAVVGLAGCLDREDDDEPPDEDADDDGALRVVIPERFVRPAEAPGRWLTERFAEEHEDSELVWISPEAGVDLYLERARRELPVEADLTMALSPTDVARIVDADVDLLRSLGARLRERAGRVPDRFRLDEPDNEVVAYLGEYVCVLYGDEREPPETLSALADEPGELCVQDPRRSALGQSFLHWTVAEFGDDAFEFWDRLADGGVGVEESWQASYERYLDDEYSLVIARASQRALVGRADGDLDRHRVAYPDGQGYAAPTFVGVFRDAHSQSLAAEFAETLLSEPVQAAVADRAGGVATLPGGTDGASGYSPEPSEPVSLDFGALVDGHERWLERWADTVGVD